MKARLWWSERREKALMWFVWHIVPREVAYWCAIRVATTANPNKSPDEQNVSQMLKAVQSWAR